MVNKVSCVHFYSALRVTPLMHYKVSREKVVFCDCPKVAALTAGSRR